MGSRRRLASVTISASLPCVLIGCVEAHHPNVALISIDCLNQRQFVQAVEGGYAPNLSALRASSIAFSRAYAQAPWTTPSHMSMITGLYPSQHGRDIPLNLMIQWNDYYPRVPRFSTLGDDLHAAGYRTAAFVGQGSISGIYGISQGFSVFEERRKGKASSDLTDSVEDVTRWLDRTKGKPFFLFFHTYDFHDRRPTGLESDKDDIRYIDQYLGRLLSELKTRGLYKDSLIIFTGDHGSRMIETRGKCCMHGAGHYEENLNIPLLLKLPRVSEPRDETVLARHIDLLPTVLDVVGVRASYDGPGRSLLRRLDGSAARGIVSFSEADSHCALRRGLVTERYNYIYTPRSENQALLRAEPLFFDQSCRRRCAHHLPIEELYDLRNDPFENDNLLKKELDSEQQKTLEHFRSLMDHYLNLRPRYSKRVVTGPRRSLDEEHQRELRDSLQALGYIN
jgi:arylsulfatase A-like enzyme